MNLHNKKGRFMSISTFETDAGVIRDALMECCSSENVENAIIALSNIVSDLQHQFARQSKGSVKQFKMSQENFVYIPGGTFLMGSPEFEEGRFDDELQHEVIVKDFSIGKFTVTNCEYNEYLKATGKPLIQKLDDLPATYVSWYEAISYCAWLTGIKNDGHVYRLPTEAEWGYACRAGSTGAYCFGDDIEKLVDYAWYNKNSGDTVHPVGQKLPNAWGIHDMHGNVWEWCSDTYEGSARVLRGGAWRSGSRSCRCAFRDGYDPGLCSDGVGFRVCQQV
jgi:formylglycine-generating enzyme required for sulfatase activity